MKKIISLILVAVMLCTVAVLAGCDKNSADSGDSAETLKFGFGVSSAYDSAKDAEGETNGSCNFVTTAVAVLLDKDGKIVKIDLDSTDAKLAWTSEGKAVAVSEIKSKYELGNAYNMAAYGTKHDGSEGKPLEWFEQADAFMTTVTGKTLAEAKALMGADGYATGDLVTAGCTINVAEFMSVLEKAVNNAAKSDATAKDTLQLAMVSAASGKDATAEAEGSNSIDTTVSAVVVNADGKVVAAKTDAVSGKVTFTAAGASTVDTTAEVKSKLELGDSYNMAAFGTKHDGSEGKPLEWYAQAAEFDKALVGKTASEFAALAASDGYATGDLATAGCTISITDMVAAAVKAATVA